MISVEYVENWPVWKVNLKAGFFNVIDGEHFCFVMVKIVIITTATMNALNVFFFKVHLNKNRDYEQIQKEQNKELIEVLTEHEGKDVLLYETKTANELKFLAKVDEDLVRKVFHFVNPPKIKPVHLLSC